MAFYKTLDASTEFSTKLIQELISEHKEYIEAYKELKDFYTGNHAILKQGTVGEVFHSDEMKQVFEKTEVEGC